VRRRLREEAEWLLGERLPASMADSLVRLVEGVPLFHVGWLRRLAAMRAGLRPAPITLAGDYLASPSIEGAVGSGEEAAERIAAWIGVRSCR
jgi:oxygen-dependent protoporphyrinogen oxidase